MLSMEGLLPGWATLLAVTLMCRDVALGNDRLQVGRLSIECATMSPATVGRDPVVEGALFLGPGFGFASFYQVSSFPRGHVVQFSWSPLVGVGASIRCVQIQIQNSRLGQSRATQSSRMNPLVL